MSVLPFARPGMISAAMLGLGRALGETIAVALVLSAAFDISWQVTAPGRQHLRREHRAEVERGRRRSGCRRPIATGLVLFAVTLSVNMAARLIIARRAEFSGANG